MGGKHHPYPWSPGWWRLDLWGSPTARVWKKPFDSTTTKVWRSCALRGCLCRNLMKLVKIHLKRVKSWHWSMPNFSGWCSKVSEVYQNCQIPGGYQHIWNPFPQAVRNGSTTGLPSWCQNTAGIFLAFWSNSCGWFGHLCSEIHLCLDWLAHMCVCRISMFLWLISCKTWSVSKHALLVDIKNLFGNLQIIQCRAFWGSEWLGFNQAARLVDDWGQDVFLLAGGCCQTVWGFPFVMQIEARNA